MLGNGFADRLLSAAVPRHKERVFNAKADPSAGRRTDCGGADDGGRHDGEWSSPSSRSSGPASSTSPSTVTHSQPDRNTTVARGRARRIASFLTRPRATKPTTDSPVTGWSSTPAFTTEAWADPSVRMVATTTNPSSGAPSSFARSSKGGITSGRAQSSACCPAP